MKGRAIAAGLALVALGSPARADDSVHVPNPDRQTLAYSDGFVIQSDWANVRLYPRVSLAVDGRGSFGAGASDLRGTDGTSELSPRVVLRRGLFELGGSAFGFLDMRATVEIDGRGTYGDALLPGAHDLRVGLPNAWINAEAGPLINLMAGVQPTPFSLERRTDPDDLVFIEPSLASQLGDPFPRALGATLWGTDMHRRIGYDVMGITAVGTTIPTSFAERGGAGRLWFRPFGLDRVWWSGIQLGVSGRWTVRDGRSADAPRDDVTTGNGFALVRRRFVDALGRTEAIYPSGTQRALGFEMRSPLTKGLDVTGELYLFDDETREAVVASAATSTERLGALRGAGYYAELTYFLDPLYAPDPNDRPRHHDVPYKLTRTIEGGLYPHPKRRDAVGVMSPIDVLTSMSFSLRVGRVDATYHPTRTASAALDGTPDPASPAGRVDVWELGGAASVWATRLFRFTAAWQSYLAPNGGQSPNRAVVAGEAAGLPDARWMHELTLRARMAL